MRARERLCMRLLFDGQSDEREREDEYTNQYLKVIKSILFNEEEKRERERERGKSLRLV